MGGWDRHRCTHLGAARLLQVHRRILQQWEGLKAAPAGSIKNRIYRLVWSVQCARDVVAQHLDMTECRGGLR